MIEAGATDIDGEDIEQDGLTHDALKRRYLDYLAQKTKEQEEARVARHYYHCDQWTSDEIKVLNDRKQPIVTTPELATKINGVVGLIEKLRQDPRAFPRNPQDDESAEVATQVIRYGTDLIDFRVISSEAGLDAATSGIGVIELSLEQGDHGDPDIAGMIVEPDTFFYDARSRRPDFSDARDMGVSKWMTLSEAKEMFRDKAQAIEDGSSSDLSDTNATLDYDQIWYRLQGKKVRIVEHWYQYQGEWHWCFYTGSLELERGVSPFRTSAGKTFCRFIAFSCNVDHDGDRYGFVRNLKSWIDESNHRRSKALHALNTKQIILEDGAVDDIELARREVHRPDGVIVRKPQLEFEIVKNDSDFQGNMLLLQQTQTQISGYGPNPQLLGEAGQANSGRAIALLQQAGISELGPYILQYRGWKLRVYRAIWDIIREHWTAERWLRVTDQEDIAQFIEVNGTEKLKDQFGNPIIGPDGRPLPKLDQNGQPIRVNHLGSLDVDIIVDEGPDSVNMMADTLDTLRNLGPNAGVPPAVFIELSPIPFSTKQKLLGMMNQPNPAQQQAQQIELAQKTADVKKTDSETARNMALAHAAVTPDPVQPQQADPGPSDAEVLDMLAGVRLKDAQTEHTQQKTALLPLELMQRSYADQARVEQSDRASERQVQARQQQAAQRQPAMSS